MGTQTDNLRALVETTSDEDVVVKYADGTEVNLGSHKDLVQRQLELSEMADEFIDTMNLTE